MFECILIKLSTTIAYDEDKPYNNFQGQRSKVIMGEYGNNLMNMVESTSIKLDIQEDEPN